MSIPSLILSHGFSSGLNLDSVLFLQVVDGIGSGNLQVISRHGQPFFQAGIAESQAQFALCQYRHPSEPWEIDFQVDNCSVKIDRHVRVLEGLVVDWKKDALATWWSSDNLWGSALQSDMLDLWGDSALQQENQQDLSDIADFSLHSQFSGIAITSESGRMAHLGNSLGMQDIMKNLRRIYELTAIGVKDNRNMAKEIKEMSETVNRTSLEVSNNGARTDDLESNLLELLGRVERIEEDLQKLVSMNQESRVNGVNDIAAQPMEEESVLQSRPQKGI